MIWSRFFLMNVRSNSAIYANWRKKSEREVSKTKVGSARNRKGGKQKKSTETEKERQPMRKNQQKQKSGETDAKIIPCTVSSRIT